MKQYKWWVVSAIIVIILPIILNWLITRPAFFNFVGDGTDWLAFWVTYFSAIASFAVVFITLKTLRQNEEQLQEMRRQWDEEHKPQIDIYFVKGSFERVSGTCCRNEYMVLEVANTGHSIAKNISFKLKLDDGISIKKEVTDAIATLGEQNNVFLFPNEVYRIPLCYYEVDITSKDVYRYKIASIEVDNSEYDSFCQNIKCVYITGTYTDQDGNPYVIETSVDPLIKKNRHVSSEEAILKIEDAINVLNFTQHNDKNK